MQRRSVVRRQDELVVAAEHGGLDQPDVAAAVALLALCPFLLRGRDRPVESSTVPFVK